MSLGFRPTPNLQELPVPHKWPTTWGAMTCLLLSHHILVLEESDSNLGCEATLGCLRLILRPSQICLPHLSEVHRT